jgi:hypothetical protein
MRWSGILGHSHVPKAEIKAIWHFLLHKIVYFCPVKSFTSYVHARYQKDGIKL